MKLISKLWIFFASIDSNVKEFMIQILKNLWFKCWRIYDWNVGKFMIQMLKNLL
jgi:hypothetical protein